jgi:alpha-1,2-mannosyltransferase
MLQRLLFFCSLALVCACAIYAVHPLGSELSYPLQVLKMKLLEDSTFCMDKGWAAFQSGKAVYETVFFQRHYKFQYPISSLLLYSMAALLHVSGAHLNKAILLLSVPATLLVAGEIFLFAVPSNWNLSRTQRLLVRAAIALLGILFYPFIYGAYLGQVQTFLTLLWGLAFYLWLRDKQELSGVCIAITCIFKPQLALFLVWALLRKQWRFLLPLLCGIVITQALSIALFGWHNVVEYRAVVRYLTHHGEVFYTNQSVNGLLQRIMKTGDPLYFQNLSFPPYNAVVYIGTLCSTALLLAFGLFVPMLRRWRDSGIDFLLFGLLATVASPIAWEHHYGYFFIASVYLLALLCTGKDTRLFFLFSACFVVLANSFPVQERLANTPWTFLLSYDLYSGLAIIAILSVFGERSSRNLVAGSSTSASSRLVPSLTKI